MAAEIDVGRFAAEGLERASMRPRRMAAEIASIDRLSDEEVQALQ